MNRSAWAPWAARTIVPILGGLVVTVAALASSGASWPAIATAIGTGAVTAAYTIGGRILEQQWPGLGRWILAAGLTRQTPAYVTPPLVYHGPDCPGHTQGRPGRSCQAAWSPPAPSPAPASPAPRPVDTAPPSVPAPRTSPGPPAG